MLIAIGEDTFELRATFQKNLYHLRIMEIFKVFYCVFTNTEKLTAPQQIIWRSRIGGPKYAFLGVKRVFALSCQRAPPIEKSSKEKEIKN